MSMPWRPTANPRYTITLLVTVLILASLACSLSLEDAIDDVPAAVGTAEEAARVAGVAAQTAAAQASDLAETAEVLATREGSIIIATVKAAATPYTAYLREKLASIEPDADGNYWVTFTEEEVNTVLRLRQVTTGDVLGAGIQSQEIHFRDGAITLTGDIFEPIPGRLDVTIRISVEDGLLILDAEQASLAGRTAPQEVLQLAENLVNGALGEVLANLPTDVRLQEITSANGELTIVGRKIGNE